MTSSEPLLRVDDLRLVMSPDRGEEFPILLGVSFEVGSGEAVAVVGESGSGKSMTTRALLGVLPEGARATGRVAMAGRDLLALSAIERARFRASQMGMIYQDPRAHINPLWTIGDFITEAVVATGVMRRTEARAKALDLLAQVGITDAERRYDQYPHQLSGGLLQRVMIVMALMPDPALLIADEATTALDVTVQAEVMAVISDLRAHRNLSVLFITHDLDLAAAVTDSVVVMYAGRVVERGGSTSVYAAPQHPYTAALLASRPDPHTVERPISIPGRPMSAREVGAGCSFAARCPFAVDVCRSQVPQLRPLGNGWVACHRTEEIRSQLVEIAS